MRNLVLISVTLLYESLSILAASSIFSFLTYWVGARATWDLKRARNLDSDRSNSIAISSRDIFCSSLFSHSLIAACELTVGGGSACLRSICITSWTLGSIGFPPRRNEQS